MIDTRSLFIDGEHVPSASRKSTPDINPYTGETMAEVAAATPADVTRAVDAAAAAFDDWAQTSPSRRRAILNAAADLLETRADEVVTLLTAETGATHGWGRFNVALGSTVLREAAAGTTHPLGEVLATDVPDALAVSRRQPAGVVAAFSPWNAPIILGCRAVATPLAVGNTVVLKGSEQSPVSSALFVAEVLAEAGLPPGVLNVITNDHHDAAEVASTLVGDARVRRVSFTGSTMVGRRIAALAAESLTPAVLELGGKNCLLVLPGADLGYAADAVAFAAYMNSGQICMSADRVVVHESLAAEFTERLARRACELRYGDPTDPATVLGPLIDSAAARRVASLVGEAVADGARLAAGGGEADGACYPATVLTEVRGDMRVDTEEIFGPVCTVRTVASVDEAVDVANDSPYGLSAGVLTEDLGLGWEVARRLHTGIVHVNDQSVDDEPQAPFGGVKDSGYGKFGGAAGIDAFTDLRWITFQTRHKKFPL